MTSEQEAELHRREAIKHEIAQLFPVSFEKILLSYQGLALTETLTEDDFFAEMAELIDVVYAGEEFSDAVNMALYALMEDTLLLVDQDLSKRKIDSITIGTLLNKMLNADTEQLLRFVNELITLLQKGLSNVVEADEFVSSLSVEDVLEMPEKWRDMLHQKLYLKVRFFMLGQMLNLAPVAEKHLNTMVTQYKKGNELSDTEFLKVWLDETLSGE